MQAKRDPVKDILQDERRAELLAAVLLLFLGCALRLLRIGALPYGLNQDEASAGYEALALLREGVDRCGNRWPALFVSWGSGQNVLMSYLAIPFVALLGLNEVSVRLPNAIFGCLTLFVFWRFTRRCGGKRFGLIALGLLAVNPWHIMASRWALESNLLPAFLLTGIWLTALSREKPWMLAGAAAAFGLSLYAYGTAFFFLPLYLVCAVILLRKQLRSAPFFVSLGIFLLLALPIGLCQLLNVLGWEEIRFLGLTLPRLSETRQAATSVFGGGAGSILTNLKAFLSILWHGGDGLIYNALPFWQGGLLYFFGLPMAVLGAVFSFLRRKDRRDEAVMRIALLCSLVCTLLIDGNVNRLNLVWLPLLYFSAYGCALIAEKLKKLAVIPAVGVLVCFVLFFGHYRDTFGGEGNVNYFPDLGRAIQIADAMNAGTVYITDWVNQPYIFALFYTQASPSDFAESVEYRNLNAAFRRVNRFGGFEFEDPARADLLILRPYQVEGREVIAEAGKFRICRGG